jgi:hypothetical protein
MLAKMITRVGLCLGLSLLLAGCGGGSTLPEGETGTVSGKVTFQGGSVPEGCVVLFIRDKDGLLATGTVDGSGNYSLTMREGSDIVVGNYRVSVSPPEVAATMDQDEIMRQQQAGTLAEATEVKEVPAEYRSQESTPLKFEVKAGPNTYDIDMKPAG